MTHTIGHIKTLRDMYYAIALQPDLEPTWNFDPDAKFYICAYQNSALDEKLLHANFDKLEVMQDQDDVHFQAIILGIDT